MPWQEWFPEYKVPRDVQRLVDAGFLRDQTKYWSLAPYFEAQMSDGQILTIHVEHPSEERRTGGFTRYEITIRQPDGFSQTMLETDNLKVAMEALRALLRSGGTGPRMAGPMMGVSEGSWWAPSWHLVEG